MNASNRVRLELSAESMERLLATGMLRAAEFRCLDLRSKSTVWYLLLRSLSRAGFMIEPVPPGQKRAAACDYGRSTVPHSRKKA